MLVQLIFHKTQWHPNLNINVTSAPMISQHDASIMKLKISGNMLALICATKNPALRTVGNKFILNLAVSDFFICTWTIPTVAFCVIRREWTLGDLGRWLSFIISVCLFHFSISLGLKPLLTAYHFT